MNLDKYSVISDNNYEAFEFLSKGPKGTIRKAISYQEIEYGVFNLAFGDWDEARQKFNDAARSNNNDRDKVLATVALTLIDFIKYHPDAIVFIKGTTPARTRLYQMGINANWPEISPLFDVQGDYKGKWELFKPDRNYQAFVLRAK